MKRSLVAMAIVIGSYPLAPLAQRESGRWEGVIEDARRPTVVFVDFDRLEGSLSGGAPLSITRPGGTNAVAFEMGLPQRALRFDGTRTDTRITGVVRTGGGEVPFWLERLPDVAPPADRVAAWRQDLDVVRTRFLRYDRSFTATSRAAAHARLTALQEAAPTLRDQQILVELSRIAALSGNAHTRLYFIRNRTSVRRIPLRVWWFGDELRIVRAAPAYRDLLRCRVVRIGDLDTPLAFERVRTIKSGNASWQRYMSAYYLTSPDVLFGAGAIDSPDRVALTVTCGNDAPRTVDLAALPLQKSTAPVEAWWDLVPSYPHTDGFETAIGETAAPRYLENARRNYWFEHVADAGVLYIQYNRSQEAADNPMRGFIERVTRVLDQPSVKGVAIDVRFNTGGDAGVGTPLVQALAAQLRGRPAFVLAGRATFSAGISHTAQWKQLAGATIIGEPVGDTLDMWAEGGNLLLPHSGLTVHYANGFHANSDREYPEHRPYFSDLNVSSVEPDVRRESSWDDYVTGRDPLFDEVLARLAATPATPTRPRQAGASGQVRP